MKKLLCIFCTIFLTFIQNSSLNAAENNTEKEAEIEADEIDYLTEEEKVIAKGNVIIKYGNRTLQTDKITYDQKEGMVSSNSGVLIIDEEKNYFFADEAEIDDKLLKGKIKNLRVKFKESGNLFAENAEKEGKKTKFQNNFFTSCKICSGNKPVIPIWRIASKESEFDSEESLMTHRNATFDIFGIPVFYTPYLYHQTNRPKRKSGFLTPIFESSNALGANVTTPYYFNLAPDYDFTFLPTFTAKEGIVLGGEFRHLTEYGNYKIKGAITNPKERDISGAETSNRDVRGYVKAIGDFILPNDYKLNFDIYRASDDTFLDRYDYDNTDLLTSTASIEKLWGKNNYFNIETIFFQGLNEDDDPGQTPFALPSANLFLEGNRDRFGGNLFADFNTLFLNRTEGEDVRRFSGTVGWLRKFFHESGNIFTFKTSIRGDLYARNDVVEKSAYNGGNETRAIPEASLKWQYPLAGYIKKTYLYIEPIIKFAISPYGRNDAKLPNEDSEVNEITEINLFGGSQFSGTDKVDDGIRIGYGVRGKIKNDSLGNLGFLLGQVYRPRENQSFTPNTGLDDNASHYVGKASYSNDYIKNIAYRFRIDEEDFSVKRSAVQANIGYENLSLNFDYIFIDEEGGEIDKNQLTTNGSFRINENWSINANSRRDFGERSGLINAGFGLTYQNDCIIINTGVERDFFRDRDIKPETSFRFEVLLKALDF